MESHTIPWFQTTNQLLTISLQTSLYYMFFLGYCGSKPWCPNTKIVKTKKSIWMLFRLYNFPSKHGFDMLWSIKPSLFFLEVPAVLIHQQTPFGDPKSQIEVPKIFRNISPCQLFHLWDRPGKLVKPPAPSCSWSSRQYWGKTWAAHRRVLSVRCGDSMPYWNTL